MKLLQSRSSFNPTLLYTMVDSSHSTLTQTNGIINKRSASTTVHRSRHTIPRTAVRKTGYELLHDARYNKGLAFSLEERKKLSLIEIYNPVLYRYI